MCALGTILTLWFEISVDEAHKMQVLQSGCDLGGIEPRSVFIHAFVRSRLQSSEELSTAAIFHAEI